MLVGGDNGLFLKNTIKKYKREYPKKKQPIT